MEWKVNARLLTSSPFVLERFGDLHLVASYSNRVERLAVLETALSYIAELNFDDLIEATLYMEPYAFPNAELGYRVVVESVRRIVDPLVFPTPTSDQNNSPIYKKVLIAYLPRGNSVNEFLIIFQDGALYYKDAQGNILSNQSLSRVQLDDLLRTFGENHFDALKSTTDLERWWQASVELVCSRFQKVSISGNEEALGPITVALDQIVASLQQHFDFVIAYREKRKINLIPWPFTEVRPTDLKRLHDEALAESRRLGRLADDQFAYTRVPQDFLEQVPSGYNNKNPVFFTDEGKIYLVSKGTNKCISTSLCKVDTFYILGAKEIREYDGETRGFGPGIKLWPKDVGLDLTMVPSDGALLDRAAYEEHREFYDNFFELYPGDTTFIQGEYIFESVKILKRER